MLAPANTPHDILSVLHTTLVKAVGTAKVTQQFAAAGSQPVANTPEEFAAHIKAEIAKWEKVTRGFKAVLD